MSARRRAAPRRGSELLEARTEREIQLGRLLELQGDELQTELGWTRVSRFEQRVYDFSTDVNDESVADAIGLLSEWHAMGHDPITMRFTSPGGDVVAGLALYDHILLLRAEGTPVDTVALGWAASMAGVLLQAGETRRIGSNAHILIHELAVDAMRGKIPALLDEMAFLRKLEDRCVAILAERSDLTPRQIKERQQRRDWWLGADEALQLGFADEIVRMPGRRRRRRVGA